MKTHQKQFVRKTIIPAIFLVLVIVGFSSSAFSQQYVQQIAGQVTDMHTGISLPGATVTLAVDNEITGTTTDSNGRFVLKNIPIGRHSLKVTYMGYKPYSIQNFLLQSGRETFFAIKLEESVQMLDEVVVRQKTDKERPLNEMAMVSARMFTIEETDRYAGTLGDPARMASNFAGVNTLNDQTNDIVIRGNSPFGLLWTLEGVDIPNPNHFGAQGATGGPISMLNNNTLSNSDFFTGAFPAQYGNALSGVFDLSLRQGNTHTYEFLGQVAFNGFELGAEGPISKKDHTSFLVNYRYSTLGVLDKIYGLEKMALTAVPYYQDLNFNATVYRGKAGRLAVFGLMGLNHISIAEDSEDPQEWDHELFGQKTMAVTSNGSTGIKHWLNIGDKFMLETTAAATHMAYRFTADTLSRENLSPSPQQRLVKQENTLFLSSRATWKTSARNIFKAGTSWQPMQYNFADSLYQSHLSGFHTRYDLTGTYLLGKSYIQWLHNFSDDFSLSSGMHFLYFSGNNKYSLEPRIGLRWNFTTHQTLSLAAGLHGHLAPRIYYIHEITNSMGQSALQNKDLDFTKSIHLVAGYDFRFITDSRLKLEAYYQHLFQVPVSSTNPGWSLLNYGAEWIDFITPTDPLVSQGTGTNYGLELTLEKFLSRGYYYLLTASVFDSKYTAFDGIRRNTAFNGHYIFNVLAGKEFKIKERNVFSIDAKMIWAGGKPILPFSSQQIGENMYMRIDDWQHAYTNRMKDYFRINLRMGYRINLTRTTHELALDIYNITNRKNIFMQLFDPITGDTRTMYQFSFMPVVLYRVMF